MAENGGAPPRAKCECGETHRRLKVNVDGVVAHVFGCPECLAPGTEERERLEGLIRLQAERMRQEADPTYVRWQIVERGEASFSPVHVLETEGVTHCGEEVPARAYTVEDTKLVRKRPCRAGCFNLPEESGDEPPTDDSREEQ